jgi:hypothetical protein
MKTTTKIIYPAFALFALTCFALAPATDAQCPQICDSNGNTAVGNSVLISNTTGFNNTAIGYTALYNNTTGPNNTATGWEALSSNTTGGGNTTNGVQALEVNTTGGDNTATGTYALYFNQTGNSNTADGFRAPYGQEFVSVTGSNNTAIGYRALHGYTTGSSNTAIGYQALLSNTKGDGNIANGSDALLLNTIGNNNIAIGNGAGRRLTIGDHNIDIDNEGFQAEANTVRIGKVGTQTATFMAGISGATVPTGVAVIVDSTGHLGTTTSSARYKEAIRPMDKASEAIFALKPVTFRYKHQLDPAGIPQFGVVAEDVEKVNPDLVARDEQGKPYTVRYEAVNAMLLNEFLKEHKAFVEEHRTVEELKKQVAALTAGLHKVSVQLELSKPAPQTVLNDQ